MVIMLIDLCALTFLLWEPHIEGKNAHATFYEIYFNDPFLLYAYIASIPFFFALYQTYTVLGFVKEDRLLSPESIKALRIIKFCSVSVIGFVVIGEIIILLSTSDDRSGGVFMGMLIILGSMVVAVTAGRFERKLLKGVDIKCANDLTE